MLISRLTNDVQALDQLVTDGVVTLFSSTLTLIGVVVILLAARRAAGAGHVPRPSRCWRSASIAFRIVAADAYRLTREKIANITAYLQETLCGVRVVRSFGQEPRHVERMAELNEENREANMRTVYLNAAYFPAVELLSAIGTGGDPALRRLPGASTATSRSAIVVAFVGYLQTFFDPIQQISQLYTTYQQGMAALDKIFDLLDTEPDMVDRPGALDPGQIRGEIELEDVSVLVRATTPSRATTSAWALRDVDLHVPAGADGRAGRRDGRREVDAREAGRAVLRPAAGRAC